MSSFHAHNGIYNKEGLLHLDLALLAMYGKQIIRPKEWATKKFASIDLSTQ